MLICFDVLRGGFSSVNQMSTPLVRLAAAAIASTIALLVYAYEERYDHGEEAAQLADAVDGADYCAPVVFICVVS